MRVPQPAVSKVLENKHRFAFVQLQLVHLAGLKIIQRHSFRKVGAILNAWSCRHAERLVRAMEPSREWTASNARGRAHGSLCTIPLVTMPPVTMRGRAHGSRRARKCVSVGVIQYLQAVHMGQMGVERQSRGLRELLERC